MRGSESLNALDGLGARMQSLREAARDAFGAWFRSHNALPQRAG